MSVNAADALPSYDWQTPAITQEEDFDCSQTATLWGLHAWGRDTSESWLEAQMIAEGVMTPLYGLSDASGAELAEFLNRHYAEYGYVASNDGDSAFDEIATEAGTYAHPLMIGGRNWGAGGHWSGCRGYDASLDVLMLANPAPGYDGIWDSLSRSQFAARGPFSFVRLTHPAAENGPALDYSWWETDGKIGSGLLEMMAADGVYPAQDWSTWLPLGRNPAQIEEALATDGTVYRWLLNVGRGFRYRPSA